jgi:hypothetical protein
MDFRACVSLRTVEQVMAAAPSHPVWNRIDPDDHDILLAIDEDMLASLEAQ